MSQLEVTGWHRDIGIGNLRREYVAFRKEWVEGWGLGLRCYFSLCADRLDDIGRGREFHVLCGYMKHHMSNPSPKHPTAPC